MATILRKLRIDTIGFVDKGANGASPVVLIKRAKEALSMNLKEKIAKAAHTLLEAIGEPVTKEDQSPQALLELALDGMPDDKKAAIMSAVAAMQMAPPPPVAPPVEPKADEPPKPPEPPKPEGDDETPEPPKEEEMGKAIEKLMTDAPEELKKALGELVDENKALTKRLDETEDLVAKSEAEKELATEVEVAKKFAHVPGDISKRAAALLSLKKADAKGYDEMVTSLTAAEALVAKSGAFSERGTMRSTESGSAQAKLDELAKAYAKENSVKFEVALSKVAKANRALYREAKSEAN